MYQQPDSYEVDAWCMQNGVDQEAMTLLKQQSPEVWANVMARGDLSTARNASAAVLGRIRDATRGGAGGGRVAGGSQGGQKRPRDPASQETMTSVPTAEEVESFLLSHAFDERAIQCFRSLTPILQGKVIKMGDMADARNVSATLLARISEARREPLNVDPSLQVFGETDLEDFIANSGVDEMAANALRMEPQHIQFAVIARGSTEGARSPSAMILARIKDAQKDGPPEGSKFMAALPKQRIALPGASQEEAQAFINSAQVDEQVSTAFWELSPEAQAMVIGRGTLMNARSPSALLQSRISMVMKNTTVMDGAEIIPEQEMEPFIIACGVDEMAAQKLRESPRHIQQAVLALGPIAHVRNPSASLLARITQENKKRSGMGTSSSQRSGGGGGRRMSQEDRQQERDEGFMEGMMQAMSAMGGPMAGMGMMPGMGMGGMGGMGMSQGRAPSQGNPALAVAKKPAPTAGAAKNAMAGMGDVGGMSPMMMQMMQAQQAMMQQMEAMTSMMMGGGGMGGGPATKKARW